MCVCVCMQSLQAHFRTFSYWHDHERADAVFQLMRSETEVLVLQPEVQAVMQQFGYSAEVTCHEAALCTFSTFPACSLITWAVHAKALSLRALPTVDYCTGLLQCCGDALPDQPWREGRARGGSRAATPKCGPGPIPGAAGGRESVARQLVVVPHSGERVFPPSDDQPPRSRWARSRLS